MRENCRLIMIVLAASSLSATVLAGSSTLALNKFGGAEVKGWPFRSTRKNVAGRYGERGGVFVAASGYDVCSLDYTHEVLKKSQFHAAIRPKFQDLSDKAGWPRIFVEPGWLALDPTSKRIKFSQGNDIEGFRWITRLDLGGFGAMQALIDGDIAYMPSTEDGSGVLFLDISNPRAIKVLGNCPVPGFPVSAAKNGDILYVYGSYQLTAINVADLSRPRVVNGIHDRWNIGQQKGPMIVIGGKYLAIPHGSSVTVFRTYPDGNLDPVAVWDLPGGYNSFVLQGTRLVLAGAQGVHVLDVTDPEQPRKIQVSHRRPINGIHAIGDRFVGTDKEGIVLFTISGNGNVRAKPPVPCQHIMDIDVLDGNVAVLTGKRNVHDSASLRLYRLEEDAIASDPIFTWNEKGFINSVYHGNDMSYLSVSGKKLFVSDFNYGPRLFVLKGKKLVQTDAMMMAGECRGFRIEEDFLHVAKNGLILVDVFTDPTKPKRLGDVYTRSGCFGLATWADTERRIVYHAQSIGKGDRLISYKDPREPRIINETPPLLKGGVWKDGLMVAFNGVSGQLVTYDISDTGEFSEVAALDVPGWKVGRRRECWMRLVGDLIYVSIGRSGPGRPFTILDISNPRACKLLGQVTIEVAVGSGIGTPGMYVDNDIAYMGGCAEYGIIVIDCADPGNPKRAGFINPTDPAFYSRNINCPDELIVVGDKLILGDYITGLRMYQFTDAKRTKAKYVANYLSPPDYPYSVYMNCSALDYHGRYLYKSSLHDLQVYEIPAPSDVPDGPVTFGVVKE